MSCRAPRSSALCRRTARFGGPDGTWRELAGPAVAAPLASHPAREPVCCLGRVVSRLLAFAVTAPRSGGVALVPVTADGQASSDSNHH